ncbi:MAG: glycerol-3-phosphate 1-O-acyltransferase PlsY [Planctomycetota bacterium]|nr:glycerol-3-phosphate 1-O-acyltransferase PlsY [Planctomycetota bacterium]
MPTHPIVWIVGTIVAAALGSIPCGLIIGRSQGIDIRQCGSGNIGATNVWRVLGRRCGLCCFALDFFKGFIPVLSVGNFLHLVGRAPSSIPAIDQAAWFCVVVAAVLGHMFSPFAGFKGGKGVATGFGGLAAMWTIATIPVLASFVIFLVVMKVSRYVSLGALVSVSALPFLIAAWSATLSDSGTIISRVTSVWPTILFSAVLAALIIFKHRSNIQRLVAGTENKIPS